MGVLSDRTLSLFSCYIEEIELFNRAYGLVKVQSRQELIVKHIFDSLAPIGILRKLVVKQVVDIGSGAGLPGIPLAICWPEGEFTLVERMGRRAGFLRNVLAILDLPNVRIEEAEMEKLSVTGFDLAVFRAFKPLEPKMLQKLFRLITPGGILTAYKGRRQSIEEEMDQFQKLCDIKWDILPLEIPFLEEERHLVVLSRKTVNRQFHGSF
jgi:16S rRNA (guanine527-N7)-methyltransferase